MDEQSKKMKWILFWVFIVIYIVVTILTILALFFGLGNLGENFKTPLLATFIIETGVGIITLFYSLFGLKKGGTTQNAAPKPNVETEIQRNVDVVEDSPLGAEIELNKPVDLLGSYNGEINEQLSSKFFVDNYDPVMMVFRSSDGDYKEFNPNVVLQMEKNSLLELNMTLSDFMDSGYSLTSEMQHIVGKRQVRVGTNIATQWYRARLTNIMGIQVDTEIMMTQFQKIVVADDLMGIMTITYGDEAKPKDIKILQNLLNDFGIKK